MRSVEINRASSVAKLFSANVLNELATKGKSKAITRIIEEAEFSFEKSGNVRIADIYDAAYDLLKKRPNRNEYIYKAALAQNVLLGVHSLNTATMLTEFRIGKCKADVVLLNGTGTVYEIKSERDSLTRLPEQVSAYRDVFASVNVIAGENHIDSIFALVPSDVGILKLSSRQSLTTVRRALNQPERTKSAAIFDSIRINEAKLILTRCGFEIPDLPNTKMHLALKSLFIQIPAEKAHSEMIRALKQSRDLSQHAEFILQLPMALRAAGLTMSLRKINQQRLLNALNITCDEVLEWA